MEQAEITDLTTLVREAQQGDAHAQRTLIRSYQARIAGFVYAVTGQSQAVEDLAQITFIKMFQALGGLKDPALFEAWLFRLARNTCIDHIRRQKWQRFFTPFEPEHSEIAEKPTTVDSEELDALRHALGKLRPKERALMALAQEGWSMEEMAVSTGDSVASVKARLHRTREKLRRIFAHDA